MNAEPAQPWFASDIDHVPGVQGGEAVLRGRRTPVRSVVSLAEEVGHDIAARTAHAAAYDASAAAPWRG